MKGDDDYAIYSAESYNRGKKNGLAYLPKQCQQLKRYWHLPRIKNQTRIQRK